MKRIFIFDYIMKLMIKEGFSKRVAILNMIRVLLVVGFLEALYYNRTLVLVISLIGFVITFIPSVLGKIVGRKIPAEFELIVILFIYGILFLAEVRGLFDFLWWDVVLNLLASIALGLVGITIAYVLQKEEVMDASPFVIVFLAFCFSFAVGGLWEIFEYSLDGLLGTTLQKGMQDTMMDLVVNAIGAFFVSLVGFFYIRKGKNIMSAFVVKFLEKNRRFFKTKDSLEKSSELIDNVVRRGESEKLEFKSTLRTNLHTDEFDKKIEHAVLKTIVAYLNSRGGSLLVGVSDKGEILGLEKDKFVDNDNLKLYLTNIIKHQVGSQFLPFIDFELFPYKDKHVLKIDCKSSNKRVFLREGREEEFYIRNGPTSTKLGGNELIDYVKYRFG